jgi:type IV pilus assembly protein PilO
MNVDDLLVSLKLNGIWRSGLKMQVIVFVVVFVLIFLIFWLTFGQTQNALLEDARLMESTLKEEVSGKIAKTAKADIFQKRLSALKKDLNALDQQIGSAANPDILVADVTSAATARGLKIDFVRPKKATKQGFYTEIPLQIKVSGTYHGLGLFVSDLAAFPRMVVLGDLSVSRALSDKGGNRLLSLDTVVKVFTTAAP